MEEYSINIWQKFKTWMIDKKTLSRNELIDNFNIGWKGNVKARLHSEKLDNKYRVRGDSPVFRAQQETYNYYLNRLEVISENL